MAKSKLKFVQTTDMFGTKITLTNTDKTFSEDIVSGFTPANPLKNMSTSVKTGYQFRSPNINLDVWAGTFKSLAGSEGKFNLTAELTEENDKKTVDAWVRFESKEDAALFAWSNVEHWQKWSDALEKEHKAAVKESKKPKKVKIDKDGKITIRATVTTLGN